MGSPSSSPSPSGRAPERRTHHRVLVGAAAWIVIEEQRAAAECVNVSMGGAAVRSEIPVKTGIVVDLELSLGNDNKPVSIRCEVVRVSPRELGLRFMALDRTSLEAILSLL